MTKSICFGSKELTPSKNNVNKRDVILAGSSASMVSKPKVIAQPKNVVPKQTTAVQPKPPIKTPAVKAPSQPLTKLKIMTSNCGEVEVFPEDVNRIWGSEVTEGFSIDVKDRTGQYSHHVYSIDETTAKELSKLSGVAIDIEADEKVEKPKPVLAPKQIVTAKPSKTAIPKKQITTTPMKPQKPVQATEFVIDAETLKETSSTLSKVVSSKTCINVLKGVKFATVDGVLRLMGADMEQYLITEMPYNGVNGGIKEPLILALEDLKRLGKTATGDIHFYTSDGRASVKYTNDFEATGTEHLQKIDGADFPEIPMPEDKFSPIEGLGKAISEASRFCNEEQYGDFKVILLSNGEVVSTNRKRLYRRFLPSVQRENDVIIPTSKFFGLKRILLTEDAGIASSKEFVWLRFGSVIWAGKIVEGSFPDYKKIVPESCENVLTLSEHFTEKVCKILASLPYEKNYRIVKIEFKNENGWKMILTSLGENSGSAELQNVSYEGNETSFCISSDYLTDALSVEGVKFFGFNKPKEVTIAWGDEVQVLTMPISSSDDKDSNTTGNEEIAEESTDEQNGEEAPKNEFVENEEVEQ